MEEIKTEAPTIYENLTKEARNLLRKEFRKSVETRFKIFLWSGIGLLLPSMISGGFSLYYMFHILLAGAVAYEFYICAAIFPIGCAGSLFLTSMYRKRFCTWLRERKDIITKADIPNKQ